MATERASGEVLIIGPSGSGKSLLLKRIVAYANAGVEPDFVDTTPTIGVEIEQIIYKKKAISVRELGGSFVQVWPRYYTNAKCVIFLFDISNATQIPTALYELFALLEDPTLNGKCVLLLLNKSESPFSMSGCRLDMFVRLGDLEKSTTCQLKCMDINAFDGVESLEQVMEWIYAST